MQAAYEGPFDDLGGPQVQGDALIWATEAETKGVPWSMMLAACGMSGSTWTAVTTEDVTRQRSFETGRMADTPISP